MKWWKNRKAAKAVREAKKLGCPKCGKSYGDGYIKEDGTEIWCWSCCDQLEYESQLEQDAQEYQELLKHSIY